MNTGYGSEPLRVRARIAGQIRNVPALDSLLGAVLAERLGVPPAAHEGELVPLAIPIARAAVGEYYLASFGEFEVERREIRYTHKRFPVEEAQMYGRDIRTLRINAGPSKGFRIPYEALTLVGDVIDWWCIGDSDDIRDLLGSVRHLGKRRGVGYGHVVGWTVEPCKPWGEGFPVARDGRPLRPLPWWCPAGLDLEGALTRSAYDMPYWLESRADWCICPVQ